MVKNDGQGSYEMVDNPVDLEAGPSTPSDEANFLRSKFDGLAEAGTRRFSFQGRRKKLWLFIGVVVSLWIVGSLVYLTGGADTVLDYYKSQMGSTGGSDAETGNDKANPEDGVEYSDEDEPLSNDAENMQNGSADQSKGNQPENNSDNNSIANNDNPVPVSQDEEQPKTAVEEPKETAKPKPSNKQKLSMNDLRSGLLNVYSTAVEFIHPPSTLADSEDEGLYYYRDRSTIIAQKGSDTKWKKILTDTLNFEYAGQNYDATRFIPNYALTHAILVSNIEKEFRHSQMAIYWLLDIEANMIVPIMLDEAGNPAYLSYAAWSPNYTYITISKDHNLYVKTTDTLLVVASDGSETLLNGKTDWVYEEEVLAVDQAIWWAPDESKMIFMKTDESDVPSYNIDYYVQGPGGASDKYPVSKKIQYPKPGFGNPRVSLHVFDTESHEVEQIERPGGEELGEEYVIYEVFFVGPNDALIKETDRESKILNVRHFDLKTKESKVVYKVDAAKEYQGWIEKFNAPLVIPPSESRQSYGYVDTYVVKGYNHLVYFETPTSEPKVLTSGDWEVASQSQLSYDSENDLVYFSALKRSSVDKHLYSVKLSDENPETKAVIDDSNAGYYDTRFSKSSKYNFVNYQGPDTRSEDMFITKEMKKIMTFTNSLLAATVKRKYALPSHTFHRVEVDGLDNGKPLELNVVEYLPENFDSAKKHPLLVHYYAGPGSQVVTQSLGMEFEDIVSSSLDAVVLYIEPRGTAGQGWEFRSWAAQKIGYWEPRDIVTVTKKWLEKGYIDEKRTACWGWSYGGFTTLKTLEFDKGETFKYGMAVAPVTNWLLYDSIYTERYMNKPENNKEGYEISQVQDVEAFKGVDRFLVMHGTADDNVHIQNTYSLLDLFDIKQVENYDVHVFPDSEHSILYHNANSVVYDKLFSWLRDAFEGDFDSIGDK